MPLFIAALACTASAAAQPPATPVQVDEVRPAESAPAIPVVARVAAIQSGPVASRTQGRVETLRVNVGDRVAKDDVIAVLDRQIQRTQRAQASAALARATAQAELAETQLGRLSKLRDSSAFEESLFDQRASELAVAQADLQRAKVELRAAQTDYSWGEIRAPFPGVVTERFTNVGAWVNRGDRVIAIVNDDTLEFAADVATARLSEVREGTEVSATVAGRTIAAQVRAIVPLTNAATQTQDVRFAPTDAAAMRGVPANSSATLLLPIGASRNVLTVHKDAINRRGDSTSVYAVEDGKAVSKPVSLGASVGSRMVVNSGLAEGDVVVIRGNERLRPGQAVAFEPPGGKAADEAAS